jgi:hypothetical protein
MDILINEMGRTTVSPFRILSVHQPRSPAPKNASTNTHRISFRRIPSVPRNGLARGMTSAWVATRRAVPSTTECMRSVSRTTASRYANELRSSIDGASCGNAWSSTRSARWTSGLHASSKSAQAVVVEVVSYPISTRGEGQCGRWGSSGLGHTRY